jgi:SPP1 family predicted phage head-tail adaptor
MNPGRLNRLVEIQQQAGEKDEYGQPLDNWEKVCETYASIQPYTGRELNEGQQIHSEVSHRITIRHRPGILPNMRVKTGSRILDILFIHNVHERNAQLQLMCRELI